MPLPKTRIVPVIKAAHFPISHPPRQIDQHRSQVHPHSAEDPVWLRGNNWHRFYSRDLLVWLFRTRAKRKVLTIYGVIYKKTDQAALLWIIKRHLIWAYALIECSRWNCVRFCKGYITLQFIYGFNVLLSTLNTVREKSIHSSQYTNTFDQTCCW